MTPSRVMNVPTTSFLMFRSALHEAVDLGRGDRALEIAEATLVLHFAGGIEQARHRGAVERGGEADALHAGGLELRDAERLSVDAGHEVDRLRHRGADRPP